MSHVPPASPQGDGDAGDEHTLLADGFEDAFLGYGRHGPFTVAVYDWHRCVTILVTRDSMTVDEAEEFIEFNVVGSWLGTGTPVFLDLATTAPDWTDRQSHEWREDMPPNDRDHEPG